MSGARASRSTSSDSGVPRFGESKGTNIDPSPMSGFDRTKNYLSLEVTHTLSTLYQETQHRLTASHGTFDFCVPYHRAAGSIILLNILLLSLTLGLDTRHSPLLSFPKDSLLQGIDCLHDPILAIPPFSAPDMLPPLSSSQVTKRYHLLCYAETSIPIVIEILCEI